MCAHQNIEKFSLEPMHKPKNIIDNSKIFFLKKKRPKEKKKNDQEKSSA
jgi:hypothetical protein